MIYLESFRSIVRESCAIIACLKSQGDHTKGFRSALIFGVRRPVGALVAATCGGRFAKQRSGNSLCAKAVTGHRTPKRIIFQHV
jgi:hypothetical protein